MKYLPLLVVVVVAAAVGVCHCQPFVRSGKRVVNVFSPFTKAMLRPFKPIKEGDSVDLAGREFTTGHRFPFVNLFSPVTKAAAKPFEFIEEEEEEENSVELIEREFTTGHRIPLELFSEETLRRIELVDAEEPAVEPRLKAYVHSDDFRKTEATSTSTSLSTSEAHVHNDDLREMETTSASTSPSPPEAHVYSHELGETEATSKSPSPSPLEAHVQSDDLKETEITTTSPSPFLPEALVQSDKLKETEATSTSPTEPQALSFRSYDRFQFRDEMLGERDVRYYDTLSSFHLPEY